MSCDLRSIVLITLLLATALAGCISSDGDTVDAGDDEPQVKLSETKGSLQGQIVTKDLDEVAGATVAAVDSNGNPVSSTQTNAEGRFILNDLDPGTYRVQVSSICCRVAVVSAEVKANQVTEVNMQVDRLTPDDLQSPYVIPTEWHGFISCGVSTPAVRAALCAVPEIVDESLKDPNEDFIKFMHVGKGLKTLIVAMTWDSVGGVSAQELSLTVDDPYQCVVGIDDCSERYRSVPGESPIIIRIDNDDIPDPAWKWDAIADEREIRLRVFTGGDAGIAYQQPFSIYIYEFYWEEAPQDFQPLPDI